VKEESTLKLNAEAFNFKKGRLLGGLGDDQLVVSMKEMVMCAQAAPKGLQRKVERRHVERVKDSFRTLCNREMEGVEVGVDVEGWMKKKRLTMEDLLDRTGKNLFDIETLLDNAEIPRFVVSGQHRSQAAIEMWKEHGEPGKGSLWGGGHRGEVHPLRQLEGEGVGDDGSTLVRGESEGGGHQEDFVLGCVRAGEGVVHQHFRRKEGGVEGGDGDGKARHKKIVHGYDFRQQDRHLEGGWSSLGVVASGREDLFGGKQGRGQQEEVEGAKLRLAHGWFEHSACGCGKNVSREVGGRQDERKGLFGGVQVVQETDAGAEDGDAGDQGTQVPRQERIRKAWIHGKGREGGCSWNR
jgi:hypothetical protein